MIRVLYDPCDLQTRMSVRLGSTIVIQTQPASTHMGPSSAGVGLVTKATDSHARVSTKLASFIKVILKTHFM